MGKLSWHRRTPAVAAGLHQRHGHDAGQLTPPPPPAQRSRRSFENSIGSSDHRQRQAVCRQVRGRHAYVQGAQPKGVPARLLPGFRPPDCCGIENCSAPATRAVGALACMTLAIEGARAPTQSPIHPADRCSVPCPASRWQAAPQRQPIHRRGRAMALAIAMPS
jgi:hypothetical protein